MIKTKIMKLIRMGRCLGLKIRYDYVSSFSAHAALFMIMSLFPLTMFLATFIRRLPFSVERVGICLQQYVPETISPLTKQILKEVYSDSRESLTWITLLVTIFCASKGFYAVRQGLNAVYGIRETRNVILRYVIAIVYVIVFVCMIVLTFIILVLGEELVNLILFMLPQFFRFEFLIHIGRFLVAFFILTFFFLVMYLNIPNRKSKIRYELPGALFTTLGWTGFSYAFSYYISHLANYSVTYGSLATMIIFMVWFYSSMYILFLGAECNVILRKYKENQCEIDMLLADYIQEYELDAILDERTQSINGRFDLIRRITENKK